MVATGDLKSPVLNRTCGFESRLAQTILPAVGPKPGQWLLPIPNSLPALWPICRPTTLLNDSLAAVWAVGTSVYTSEN